MNGWMDDGLTMAMGYRVVDRIGSDRSSMDRWRCDASVAMRVVYA